MVGLVLAVTVVVALAVVVVAVAGTHFVNGGERELVGCTTHTQPLSLTMTLSLTMPLVVARHLALRGIMSQQRVCQRRCSGSGTSHVSTSHMSRGQGSGRGGDGFWTAEHGVDVSPREACVDGDGGLVVVVIVAVKVGVGGEAHGVE